MNNRRNIFTLPLLFPSLVREAPRIHWRDAVIGLDCATFSPAHPGRAKTRPCPCEGLPLLSLVLHPHAREWPDYPLLRASNDGTPLEVILPSLLATPLWEWHP